MVTGSDTNQLITVLREGGVAIFPTDTVYGIGCRVDSITSIQRVYACKERGLDLRMPVLLADASQIDQYTTGIPSTLRKLIDRYWPGGLTIVLPVKPNSVLPILQNDNGGVSFRVPDQSLLRDVIRTVGVPIIGTSANLHGKPAVDSADVLDPQLCSKVDYVFHGDLAKGTASTVIEYKNGDIVIHREGSVPKSAIEAIIGEAT